MDWIRYCLELAQVLACIALLRGRFARTYPLLCAYLGFASVRDIVTASMDIRSTAYALTWAWSEPIVIVLQVGFALEAMLAVLSHYPQIGITTRRMLTIAAFAGSALGGTSLFVTFGGKSCPIAWLPFVIGAWKASGWVSLACVCIGCVFRYLLPNTLCRNLRVHLKLATVFLACGSALTGIFLSFPDPDVVNAVVAGSGMIQTGCCLAWAFWMRPTGQLVARTEIPISPKDRRHYARIMDAIRSAASWQTLG